MTVFLPITAIADATGLSPRAVKAAAFKTLNNPDFRWRGSALAVRVVHGRGGRSGQQYQIRVDSLPADLQEYCKALGPIAASPLQHGDRATIERDWWFGLLGPALEHPRYSRERGKAIRDIVSREHIRPDGKKVRLSDRTIQMKLAAFENQGLAGISRRKRSDAGQRRTILFRAWDNAVPFEAATKERIAHGFRQYIRGLQKAGENPAMLTLLAAEKLKGLTKDAGFDPGPDALEKICRVPENVFRAERIFRKVHLFRTDRKAYEDQRSRISRHRDFAPMDIIVADVHPVDIFCRREDGSEATPRAIAWLDLATNRIWLDLVLLDKGQGVRNEHVIASFARMVNVWGAPRALYVDNGSEYNWAAFADDALKLIDRDRRILEHIAPWNERDSNIIRAMPYNAAAKPVEGIFKILEHNYFSSIPGWVGGDRMRKKSANVGRRTEPFDGTFAELCTLIRLQVQLYENTKQKGSLKNRSPQKALADAVEAGWGMTAINPDALRIAFSTPETRVVRQGRIQCHGQSWTCPELQAYQGDRVIALLPKYEDWSRIPLQDEQGRLFAFAEPDRTFGFLDPEGARESARRAALHRSGIRVLEKAAPDVDRLGERNAYALQLPAPTQVPVIAHISHSDEAAAIVAGLKESPEERREREQRQAETKAERHNAEMLRIGSKFNPNRRNPS